MSLKIAGCDGCALAYYLLAPMLICIMAHAHKSILFAWPSENMRICSVISLKSVPLVTSLRLSSQEIIDLNVSLCDFFKDNCHDNERVRCGAGQFSVYRESIHKAKTWNPVARVTEGGRLAHTLRVRRHTIVVVPAHRSLPRESKSHRHPRWQHGVNNTAGETDVTRYLNKSPGSANGYVRTRSHAPRATRAGSKAR